jgi:hypothetical protein
MDGMLRGLRLIGTILLVPVALALLLVLLVAAALWYYLNTLLYLGQVALHWLRPVARPTVLQRPHFGERAAPKASVK